ncbi:MAG TPA: hypothetical protein VMW08_01195 [Acidimicrobiales bacterium]|nr:hypothetical protein [Acidimicrobiales bacterium]
MRPPRQWIWAVWLIVLLLVPAGMIVTGTRPNDVSRDRRAAPKFEFGRLLDRDYYAELDALAARSPGEGLGLWATANLDYEVFGESNNSNVLVGSDGWLFWKPYVDFSCDDIDAISVPDIAEPTPGSVRYLTLPTKSSLYGDLLPDGTVPACAAVARQDRHERFEDDRLGLDPAHVLDEVLADGATADLFYRADTHWTPLARVLVAERLIDELQPGLWDADAVQPNDGEPFEQGLAAAIGLDRTITEPGYTIERGGELRVIRDTLESSFGAGDRITEMRDVDVIEGTTLIVGDSQFQFLAAELEPYFERLVFVTWAIAPEYDFDAAAPDRVIFEAIEPGVEGWFESEMADRAIAAISD